MSNVPPPSSPEPPRPPRTNTATVVVVVVVVVAVVIGFVALGYFVNGSSSSSAAQSAPTTPSHTVTSPSPPGHTQAPPPSTPTNLPALNCQPAPPLPKNPQQFAKAPSPSLSQNATWQATVKTNCGTIVMDLDGKAAPQTVASFLFLSQKKFYDDTPCHRLTTAAQGLYVLQCGDPTGTGSGSAGYSYGIENAPADGSYPTGTVAMARSTDPNSNSSQFFIVYQDTTLPTQGGGYSIFGSVVKGLPIVQAIAAKGLASDGQSPAQPVSILSISIAKK